MLQTAVYANIPYTQNLDTSKIKFIDIPANHWAKSTIVKLAAQNIKIIRGYPDGTFRPDSNMTRAEFVTALVRTMGYSVMDEVYSTYKDVSEKHWASKYIGAAQQRGIIDPTDYGDSFKPEEIITRFEACRMLINSFSRTKLAVNDNSVTMYPVFKDAKDLDQKNKKIVHILYKKGILKGFDNGIAGLNYYATRAELSAFILRFIENSDKLENYIVTEEDTKEIKPYYNTNGEYVTYRSLLPDNTQTVKGWAKRNPELSERINYIEWEHIGKNYNGKYKSFITQLKKKIQVFGNPFKIDVNNVNIVALNVTVSYTGKIDGYWVYDYSKLLRIALFRDNSTKPIEFKYVIALEELDGWYNNKPIFLGRFTKNNRVRTYTLVGISRNLPSTGEVRLSGGNDSPDATDYRSITVIY